MTFAWNVTNRSHESGEIDGGYLLGAVPPVGAVARYSMSVFASDRDSPI
jgi:hypothetical protein